MLTRREVVHGVYYSFHGAQLLFPLHGDMT